jgi:amino acid permease
MILLNIFAVKYYGESEFVMAVICQLCLPAAPLTSFQSTKILLIMGLILLTFITMVGGNPKYDAYGFRYWGNGNAMHEYLDTVITGWLLGWWKVVLYAVFLVAGPDLLALAAGEISNPRRHIPRVARRAFHRIAGFHSASRTLYLVALDGQAPAFFKKCTKSGILMYCVAVQSSHRLSLVHGLQQFVGYCFRMVRQLGDDWVRAFVYGVPGRICWLVQSSRSTKHQ